MVTRECLQECQGSGGMATILAIGTAVPPIYIYQEEYPDFYFRVTKSEHKTELKDKFKRICARSEIKKRHFIVTEEILKENPNICTYKAPSLDVRQHILVDAVPKLGQEAALKAIKEWGKPVSKITHLIVSTSSGCMLPGADHQLIKLLNLNANVNRVMISNQGCGAGGTVLRLAKDLAENNPGSRVLLVCVESSAINFHAPMETHFSILVGQSVFGDGASAAIVGTNPNKLEENPLFEIVSASQVIVPETEGALVGQLYEMGWSYDQTNDLFSVFAAYLDTCLNNAFCPFGIKDWNSLFYAMHPGGGMPLLNLIQKNLGLKEEKLRATKNILREYGNMASATVIFILEELRQISSKENKVTTGEGSKFGVLFSFGAGLTVETVVLHSVCI